MGANRVPNQLVHGRSLLQFFFEILQSPGIDRRPCGPVEVRRIAEGSLDAAPLTGGGLRTSRKA